MLRFTLLLLGRNNINFTDSVILLFFGNVDLAVTFRS